MTCQDMSCSFDSSAGTFPNGYCIWENIDGLWEAVACHCKEGYCCGDPPIGFDRPTGQFIKVPCVPKQRHQHEQR